MTARPPTPRQLETLQHVYNHWRTRGYGPCIRDLAEALGGINKHAAAEKVDSLCKKGLLTRTPRVTRSTRLTTRGLEIVDRT